MFPFFEFTTGGKMKKFVYFLFFVFLCGELTAQVNIQGDYTVGMFSGTPFWNRENYEDGSMIDNDQDWYRLYNKLRIGASYDDFSLKFNGLRSDNFYFTESERFEFGKSPVYFSEENHIYNNKIYQLYAQYKTKDYKFQIGRILPFNRWIFGSVDGLAADVDITDKISVRAFGGADVRYGLIYDDKDRNTVAYGEVAYRDRTIGGKVKAMKFGDDFRSGFDMFYRYKMLRFSLDLGYDFTNERLFDGTFGFYAYLSKKFNVSANAARFIPISWSHRYISEYIDRLQAAATYRISDDYALSFRQMVSTSNDFTDYLSYLYLTHKYFYGGVNYLGGDSGNERLGISIGGNYPILENLRVSAGIASVDYMFDDRFVETRQAYSTYLKVMYKVIDDLSLRAYFNYYDNNSTINTNLRAGITAQYRFEGGWE